MLDEDSHIAPPYTNMGEPLLDISSLERYLQIGLQASSSISSRCFSWTCTCIISSLFITMMSWRWTWIYTLSYSSRHTCNMLSCTHDHSSYKPLNRALIIISKLGLQASSKISSRCFSWTCTSQDWWRSPLDVILHGQYEFFFLM